VAEDHNHLVEAGVHSSVDGMLQQGATFELE